MGQFNFCHQFIFLVVFSSSFAQNLGNSPYTQYGIGDLASESLQRPNQMGEAGSASASANFINNLNPALLAHNQYTTLDFGLAFKSKMLQTKTSREYANGFNFVHGSLLLPVAKWWSSMVCIKPHSSVNYTIQGTSMVNNDSSSTYNFSFKGRGGMTNFYWSNGFKLSKMLYVGLETAYVFGKTDDDFRARVPNSNFDNVILKSSNSSHIRLKPGVVFRLSEYRKPIMVPETADSNNMVVKGYLKSWTKKDSSFKMTGKTFSAGLTIERYFSMATNQMTTLQKVDGNDFAIVLDTVNRANFNIQLPSSVRLGLAYEKLGKWSYVADLKMGYWSGYVNDGRNKEKLRNTIHIGVGSERYQSFKVKSVDRYFQLRYGAYYSELPYIVRDMTISESAITGGFSFLMPKIKGEGMQYPKFINVGFAIGQRGTIENSLIRETFFKLNFGVTVNDIWFVRPRVD